MYADCVVAIFVSTQHIPTDNVGQNLGIDQTKLTDKIETEKSDRETVVMYIRFC